MRDKPKRPVYVDKPCTALNVTLLAMAAVCSLNRVSKAKDSLEPLRFPHERGRFR